MDCKCTSSAVKHYAVSKGATYLIKHYYEDILYKTLRRSEPSVSYWLLSMTGKKIWKTRFVKDSLFVIIKTVIKDKRRFSVSYRAATDLAKTSRYTENCITYSWHVFSIILVNVKYPRNTINILDTQRCENLTSIPYRNILTNQFIAVLWLLLTSILMFLRFNSSLKHHCFIIREICFSPDGRKRDVILTVG